jgi:hypothetical protein
MLRSSYNTGGKIHVQNFILLWFPHKLCHKDATLLHQHTVQSSCPSYALFQDQFHSLPIKIQQTCRNERFKIHYSKLKKFPTVTTWLTTVVRLQDPYSWTLNTKIILISINSEHSIPPITNGNEGERSATVAEWSRAWMFMCIYIYSMLVLSCVGRGLAMSWSLIQGGLP